jgi:hypothetical protein
LRFSTQIFAAAHFFDRGLSRRGTPRGTIAAPVRSMVRIAAGI